MTKAQDIIRARLRSHEKKQNEAFEKLEKMSSAKNIFGVGSLEREIEEQDIRAKECLSILSVIDGCKNETPEFIKTGRLKYAYYRSKKLKEDALKLSKRAIADSVPLSDHQLELHNTIIDLWEEVEVSPFYNGREEKYLETVPNKELYELRCMTLQIAAICLLESFEA